MHNVAELKLIHMKMPQNINMEFNISFIPIFQSVKIYALSIPFIPTFEDASSPLVYYAPSFILFSIVCRWLHSLLFHNMVIDSY